MLAANHIEDLDWATFAFLCWTCSEHGPSSDSVQQRSRGEHASWRPTPWPVYKLTTWLMLPLKTHTRSQDHKYYVNVNVNITHYKISRQIPPSCLNCNAKNSSCKSCSDMSSSPYVLCISNFGRTARSSLLARMVVENLQPREYEGPTAVAKGTTSPNIWLLSYILNQSNFLFWYYLCIHIYIYISLPLSRSRKSSQAGRHERSLPCQYALSSWKQLQVQALTEKVSWQKLEKCHPSASKIIY